MDGTGTDCPLGMRLPNLRLRELDCCSLTVMGKPVVSNGTVTNAGALMNPDIIIGNGGSSIKDSGVSINDVVTAPKPDGPLTANTIVIGDAALGNTVKSTTIGVTGGNSITNVNNLQVTTINGVAPGTIGGSGTDKHLVRWNGTSAIQDGTAIEDNVGNFTSVRSINVSNAATSLTSTTTDPTIIGGLALDPSLSISVAAGTNAAFLGSTYSASSAMAVTGVPNGGLYAGNYFSGAGQGLTVPAGTQRANVVVGCNGQINTGVGVCHGIYSSDYCSCDTSGTYRNQVILASNAVLSSTNDYVVSMGYNNATTPLTANRKIEMYNKTGNISIAGALTPGVVFTDIGEFYENSTISVIPAGTVVALCFDGTRRIKVAQPGDVPLGAVSETASIRLGDSPFTWAKRFLHDKTGKPIMELQEDKAWVPKPGQTEEDRPFVLVQKENEAFDPKQVNIPRSERPDQWSLIATYKGAQIFVRIQEDAGVKAGDYLTVAKDGVCVPASTGIVTPFRVLDIPSPDLAWCYFG